MAGLTELNGSLIQMNAHMKMTGTAVGLTALGFIVAAICMFGLIVTHLIFPWEEMKKQLRATIVLIAIVIIGLAAGFFGVKLPREKVIKACANGPISIEQISSVYDVVNIDGKMLTLKERR